MKAVIAIAVIGVLLITCKHEIPLTYKPPEDGTGKDTASNSRPCNPDSVYFANTVLPVITSSCATSGCHDSGTHEEGLILNSYSGLLDLVQPGEASESKLYEVITAVNSEDIMPPPPHQKLSQENINAIQKWINQGAKNNECNGCDTTVFTYSAAVLPIINNYCKGCHNPVSLGGSIDLSTYNGVKSVALSGRLLGSIQHTTTYVTMPQGGSKLQNCQIRQIEKWIQSGTPDN